VIEYLKIIKNKFKKCFYLDRYRLVPYSSCSLRLFSLQINLLDDFLQDLILDLNNEQQDIDPLSKYFCSILNSIVYTADVIQQWKNRSVRIQIEFFVLNKIYIFFEKHYKHLQYLYNEYKIFIEKYGINNLEENSIEIDSTLAQQFDLIQLNKENQLINVTIFDHLLEQYRDEEEQICTNIVNHIVKIFKNKSRRYIKEK